MINTMNINTKKATDELKKINASREKRRIAEIYENGELDRRLSYTYGVDTGRIEGRAEGLIEGKAEGLVEGKNEGLIEGQAKGRAEGLIEKAREIAKSLLAQNIDINIILSSTGLTKKELEELKSA